MLTDDGVRLASAWNVEDVLDAPLVSVSSKRVFVDGQLAGSTSFGEDETGPVGEVTVMLAARRKTWKELQPDKPFPGVVVLHVDQDTPAYIVKRVTQSVTRAGYPNVGFMVKKRFD